MITIGQIAREGARRLKERGIESADADARLLACHAFGLSREDLASNGSAAANADMRRNFESALLRRAKHEPVARIVGEREFWSKMFHVKHYTLVPRPETETLIEAALEFFKKKYPPKLILDLGTGTGCLAVSLLKEFPAARAVAGDISKDALEVAADNAKRHGVADRMSFIHANWADGIEGSFDLVVSNPPYVARAEIARLAPDVAQFDPHLALDGGEDGLDAYRAIALELPRLLAGTGVAIVESGANQAPEIERLFMGQGLEIADKRRDLLGIIRAIVAI